MYNITVGNIHPSVICVEISKLVPSLRSLRELLQSGYIEEGLQEFIEDYSRKDEVMPSDKTVGFVVVNSAKRMMSLSFSSISRDLISALRLEADEFKKIGYTTELDVP